LDRSNDLNGMPDEGRSFVQTLVLILVVILALLFVFGIPTGLFLLGDGESSWLERLRDVTIVLMGILWLLIIALLAVMVFVMVWVAFQIKNRVLPMLEDILVTVKATSSETTETVRRARGTVEFVSERVAAPIISSLSTVAKWRATARMFVTGKDKRS
jgi:hypothetical protein